MLNKAEPGKHLYIIVSKITGSIKIGRSSNIAQRLLTLQTANSFLLKIVLILENQGNKERYYHELCRKYKINGEWFTIDCLSEFETSVYELIDLDSLYDFIYS